MNICNNYKLDNSRNCYWCCDRSDLFSCSSCKRFFCRFCLNTTKIYDEEICTCLLCCCFENSKAESEDGNIKQILHRYENICNRSREIKNINELFDDMETIQVNELHNILNVMQHNTEVMLNDLKKLSNMVNKDINEKYIDGNQHILLRLFKVLTKHHLFHRLGRPKQCSNLHEMEIDMASLKIGHGVDELPLSVAKDKELITPMLKVIDEYDYSDDSSITYMSEYIKQKKKSKDSYSNLKKPSQINTLFNMECKNYNKKSSAMKADELKLSSKINVKSELYNNSQSEIAQNYCDEIHVNGRFYPMSTSLDPNSVQNPSLMCDIEMIKNKSHKRSRENNHNRMITKYNPHLVPQTDIHQEKSFFIKSDKKVNPYEEKCILSPVNKMWSWERSNSITVLPSKRRISSKDSHISNVQAKVIKTSSLSDRDRKSTLSPDQLANFVSVRRKGRPRKYFSNYFDLAL